MDHVEQKKDSIERIGVILQGDPKKRKGVIIFFWCSLIESFGRIPNFYNLVAKKKLGVSPDPH